jgi:hypothetical protein
MSARSDWLFRIVGRGVGLLAAVSVASTAHAAQTFDNQRGELAARVATQNTFQHNDAHSINWVQWRNEVRFDLKYDLIAPGSGDSWGPINTFRFNMLYRGRLDSAYLLRDSYQRRGYDRGDFEFPEGKTPRELFVDIGFRGALQNLSFRIGKQQVVWGEADLFRSLDVVNPLDIRQNGPVGEDFADFRQPLWIAKALYDFGDLGRYMNSVGLELFFSPNSRPQASQQNVLFGETFKLTTLQHNVLTGFQRNLAEPFDQVRAPWELGRVGARYGDSPAVVQTADGNLVDFMYLIRNDVPPSELSVSAMMAGVRILGTTFGNANFTLNYLFKRSDSASSAVAFSQLFDPSLPGTGALQPDVQARAVAAALTPDTNGNGIPDGQDQQILDCLQSRHTNGHGEFILDPHALNPAFAGSFDGSVYSDPKSPQNHTGKDLMSYRPVLPVPGDGLVHSSACLDIPVFHPWTHIIGATLNYNDEYTGLVFRLEQSFSTKEPRQLSNNSPERLLAQRNATVACAGGDLAACASLAPGPNTVLAVPTQRDFETRAKRYTQVWRSMIGADWTRSIASNYGRTIGNPLLRSLLSDQWVVSFQFLNEYDTHADHVDNAASFTNRYQHWNPFFTVSGTGFFMYQRLRPVVAFAFDPNQLVPLFYVQAAYFVTPKVEVRLGEVLYAGSKNAEDNGGLHYYADRDTFFIRLTYFLA